MRRLADTSPHGLVPILAAAAQELAHGLPFGRLTRRQRVPLLLPLLVHRPQPQTRRSNCAYPRTTPLDDAKTNRLERPLLCPTDQINAPADNFSFPRSNRYPVIDGVGPKPAADASVGQAGQGPHVAFQRHQIRRPQHRLNGPHRGRRDGERPEAQADQRHRLQGPAGHFAGRTSADMRPCGAASTICRRHRQHRRG